ncbi:hypothetical protein HPB47_010505 [Ixodes persulcatus]|uniref:Uncharacterized protein n=1 Tax=Ixodes persulcatus TaxID=34615 RepID=A0AC60NYY6_IXOPE|nr:hypothetical protein HPB47_010505 [Ixodes persulcatus]
MAAPLEPLSAQAGRKRFTIVEDILLLREVLAMNLFVNSSRWDTVAANLNEALGRNFSVRGVRDRCDLLLGLFKRDDRTNLRKIIAHVYESYKGRDKEWESHEQPFVLLSHWSGKVLTKVTASETTDVVEFIADMLKTIKRAMQYKHHIEATYIHCLATDILRYRLITVDTVDSWK